MKINLDDLEVPEGRRRKRCFVEERDVGYDENFVSDCFSDMDIFVMRSVDVCVKCVACRNEFTVPSEEKQKGSRLKNIKDSFSCCVYVCKECRKTDWRSRWKEFKKTRSKASILNWLEFKK